MTSYAYVERNAFLLCMCAWHSGSELRTSSAKEYGMSSFLFILALHEGNNLESSKPSR
jgi:hypothetical protein